MRGDVYQKLSRFSTEGVKPFEYHNAIEKEVCPRQGNECPDGMAINKLPNQLCLMRVRNNGRSFGKA